MKKFFCVLCSLVIVSSLVTLPVKAEAKESGYDDYVEEYGCRVSEMTFVRTTYWTDVYGGANNTTNYRNALNYGVKKVTIQW